MPGADTELIVTFSGQVGGPTLATLWDSLCGPDSGLNLKPDADGAYTDPTGFYRLLRFAVPQVEDSALLQLRLRTTEGPTAGWAGLWQMLQTALATSIQNGTHQVASDLLQARDLWGWTAVFAAACADDKGEWLSKVPGAQRWEGVYRASIPGGHLWLLEPSVFKESNQVGQVFPLVYVATYIPANHDMLIHFLLGPGGLHPVVELMMHKCYYQRAAHLEHRGRLMGTADRLRQANRALLEGQVKELDRLDDYYVNLKAAAAIFRQIQGVILANRRNYHQIVASYLDREDGLWQRHAYRLTSALAQLEHDLGYLEAPLDAAEAALDVLRARLAERSNMILWLLAAALGMGQIAPDDWSFGLRLVVVGLTALLALIAWWAWREWMRTWLGKAWQGVRALTAGAWTLLKSRFPRLLIPFSRRSTPSQDSSSGQAGQVPEYPE